ncbi:MAG: hypothetical protein EBW35_07825 [Rhodobacterales bacterium]|nr:hypothetical protein [Rhodobacterales bacterium]
MQKERLFIYDTTLRDGQQTQGVQFSLNEKLSVIRSLDDLGVDYIEGGWPGANPVDSELFESIEKTKANFTAFGMTKRSGRSAENDEILSSVLNSGTSSVCLVGKSHDFHVEKALGISLDENLINISSSISHLVNNKREAIFDAEHFFDGFKDNSSYAIQTIKSALDAGARWVVLCDTNGGCLPNDIRKIVDEVIRQGISGDRLGIHAHNDTENAVANTLAAIDSGVRQIQGTLNGLGERCGNANLTSIIPTLLLKKPYKDQFETNISMSSLSGLTRVSRQLDDIINRIPLRQAPYVGASAFAHKAGLHASAIIKDPTTYEHIVVVKVDGEKKLSASESMDEIGSDRGPINALSKALTKDLGSYQNLIDDIKLVDFKVRITQGGTEAMTRVVIDSEDKNGVRWSTVGVSPNIVDASFEALLDAINWKLVRDTS